MNHALVILGPTATGKTRLALTLAHHFGGELISADSRQVYRGLNLFTNKELESNSSPKWLPINGSKYPYFLLNHIRVWGYDLADPSTTYSVANYYQAITAIVTQVIADHKLPIIVGGTGLYIKTLFSPPPTLGVITNPQLRASLATFSLSQLQQHLIRLDPDRFTSMNHSDQHNPRRLIRAIEVVSSTTHAKTFTPLPLTPLKLGLTGSLPTLKNFVTTSINNRLNQPLDKELAQLTSSDFDWLSPAATSTGLKLWRDYRAGHISRQEAISAWISQEHAYQKRQLTWFKRDPTITWFSHDDFSDFSQLEQAVVDWYSNHTPKNHETSPDPSS